MKLILLFFYWFSPSLWFNKRFWKYDHTTPSGYKLKCRCGVFMVFDK